MATRRPAAAAPGTDQRFPPVVADVAQEEDLRAAPPVAPAQQARGKDPAPVHDQEVARRSSRGRSRKT
jgi:hypothetical protein